MTVALFLESVGGGEWLVLLAVILVVVGPKNLPAAARKIGQIMSQLRRAADEFKRQLMTMDQEVRQTVDSVKQEYMNVGQDVQNTVAGTDSAATPADGSTPADPASTVTDTSTNDDPAPDSEDRAIWESYGRDYDPESIYGYDPDETSGPSADPSAEQPAASADPATTASVAETSTSETPPPAETPA